jgi:hypothetical protein
LRDAGEKFRRAMVSNAGLDNDVAQLTYEADLLKDQGGRDSHILFHF